MGGSLIGGRTSITGFLSIASVYISARAIERLAGVTHGRVHATWYAFAVLGLVLVLDLSRTILSWRTARRYASAAIASPTQRAISVSAGPGASTAT